MKKFILTRSSAFWGGGITLIYSYIGFSKKMRPYAANLCKNKYIVYLMNQCYSFTLSETKCYIISE